MSGVCARARACVRACVCVCSTYQQSSQITSARGRARGARTGAQGLGQAQAPEAQGQARQRRGVCVPVRRSLVVCVLQSSKRDVYINSHAVAPY